MIKTLLSTILLGASLGVSAQVFNGAYLFTSVTSTSGVTDPTPPPTAANVTFGAFSAAGVSANPNAGGRFSFTSWGTGASTVAPFDTYSSYTGSISLTQYYDVSVTPAANYAINFNKIYFNVRRSGTGIRNYAIRSSVGGYAANLPASIVPTNTNLAVLPGDIFFWAFDATSTANDQKGSTVSLSGLSFQNVTTATAFRFYAWNAESTGGTFSVDSVDISGTASLSNNLREYSHQLQAGFKLYPNPSAQTTVMIEPLDKTISQIEVYDVLGKLSLTQTLTSTEKFDLDLSTLNAGTYFVKMKSDKKVYTEKLVIFH
jgi:hypothetical protein